MTKACKIFITIYLLLLLVALVSFFGILIATIWGANVFVEAPEWLVLYWRVLGTSIVVGVLPFIFSLAYTREDTPPHSS